MLTTTLWLWAHAWECQVCVHVDGSQVWADAGEQLDEQAAGRRMRSRCTQKRADEHTTGLHATAQVQVSTCAALCSNVWYWVYVEQHGQQTVFCFFRKPSSCAAVMKVFTSSLTEPCFPVLHNCDYNWSSFTVQRFHLNRWNFFLKQSKKVLPKATLHHST